MSMINVGIVDDHAIVRSGLRQFLSEHVDLRVTHEASSGKDALAMARSGEVDVILMDISMPDQSGSMRCRLSGRDSPTCRCSSSAAFLKRITPRLC
jgi:DNA-binding NarL/FixJ family response regulator